MPALDIAGEALGLRGSGNVLRDSDAVDCSRERGSPGAAMTAAMFEKFEAELDLDRLGVGERGRRDDEGREELIMGSLDVKASGRQRRHVVSSWLHGSCLVP